VLVLAVEAIGSGDAEAPALLGCAAPGAGADAGPNEPGACAGPEPAQALQFHIVQAVDAHQLGLLIGGGRALGLHGGVVAVQGLLQAGRYLAALKELSLFVQGFASGSEFLDAHLGGLDCDGPAGVVAKYGASRNSALLKHLPANRGSALSAVATSVNDAAWGGQAVYSSSTSMPSKPSKP
jgi:hypothetical protein